MTIFHIDHLPNEISLPSSSKYCFVLSWLDENSLFTDSNHSLYFITTMSNHSAKQVQSYRQSDVEIKNPIWLAEWKVPLFIVGKFILNSSCAEFDRDTQSALCMHGGRKKKVQNLNKLWGSIPAQVLPTISLMMYVQLFGKCPHY